MAVRLLRSFAGFGGPLVLGSRKCIGDRTAFNVAANSVCGCFWFSHSFHSQPWIQWESPWESLWNSLQLAFQKNVIRFLKLSLCVFSIHFHSSPDVRLLILDDDYLLSLNRLFKASRRLVPPILGTFRALWFCVDLSRSVAQQLFNQFHSTAVDRRRWKLLWGRTKTNCFAHKLVIR